MGANLAFESSRDKENPVSVLELIGRAPLIMLRRADESGTIELHAKAEFQNPGGW